MTKLLVVDDMAIFREPIAASLRRAGYETVCASNGNEALELIRGERPDLILLDIAMPIMDGLTCLKAIRKHPATSDIPVIILTALAEREMLTQAIGLGVQGYLLKSQFSLDDLLTRIRKVLDSRTETPPKPEASAPADGSQEGGCAEKPVSTVEPPEFLSGEETLEQIHREAKLRAVPAVLHHVMSLTGSSRTSFDELASAVRKDHALAVKVMTVANSSFFATGKSAQNLMEAAQRIGMMGVRNAIASILTIEHFSSASTGGLTPQRFWEHSLASAALADLIAQAAGMPQAEHVFLAGLLHDIGRLMLSAVFPEHYEWVLQAGAERNIELITIEQEVFGLGHDEVTKELLTQWQTPEEIREAASAHELSVEQIERNTRDPQSALIVALSNRLAHASVLGDSGDSTLLATTEHAKALKLDGESVRAIARQAADKTDDTETFYASRTGQDFRGPLAEELARKVDGKVELKVFAIGSPGDPLSVFCERLGWLAPRKPRCAILFSSSQRGLITRFNELVKYEAAIGARLGVLIASPEGSCSPPPHLVEGRSWATVQVPGRYAPLIDAVARLQAEVAREPAPARA